MTLGWLAISGKGASVTFDTKGLVVGAETGVEELGEVVGGADLKGWFEMGAMQERCWPCLRQKAARKFLVQLQNSHQPIG